MTRVRLAVLVLLLPTMLGAQGAPSPAAPISDERLEALAVERGSVRAWLELARRRAAAEGPAAGLDAVRRALDLAPNSEDVLSVWARLNLAAGRPTRALSALEPLVRLHPDDPEYTYLLGVTWLQVGELIEAVESLERAVTLRPDRPRPKIALGLAWNAQKRFAEARDVLDAALRLAPDEPEALAAYAESLEGLGQLDDAERYARRTLESTAHPTAHLVLGMVAMKRGDYPVARASLEQAVALGDARDAAPPKAHYQLSLAYARLGERELSERHRRLYQEAQDATERRLLELRGQAPPEDSR